LHRVIFQPNCGKPRQNTASAMEGNMTIVKAEVQENKDEQGRYRVETWSSVRTLWNRFGEKADEVFISMYPDMPAFIDDMFKQGRKPEWTALLIVAQVVTDYVHSLTVEEKEQILVELHKLHEMKFEEAEGYMALWLVHSLVEAWKVTQKWIDEGRLDGSASTFLIGKILRTLAQPSL
jgi:hypothetical protein